MCLQHSCMVEIFLVLRGGLEFAKLQESVKGQHYALTRKTCAKPANSAMWKAKL